MSSYACLKLLPIVFRTTAEDFYDQKSTVCPSPPP